MEEVIASIFLPVIISLLVTWVSFFAQEKYKKREQNEGELKFYKKIVYNPISGNTWGFCEGSHKIFSIPIRFEIVNTKGVNQVVRDVKLVLYENGTEIVKMKQIENYDHRVVRGQYEKRYFGDNGSYSFVIKPESVKNVELFFNFEDNGKDFDEVKLKYFDKEGIEHTFHLLKIDNAWDCDIEYDIDSSFELLLES